MKKIMSIILFVPNSINSKTDIIKFWESRRVYYNLIVGLFGVLFLLIASIISDKMINFFILPFIIMYGIMCNIFYTSGWLCTLLLRDIYNGDIGKFIFTLFVIGTVLSVIVTFIIIFLQLISFL